jgi:CheY-like chemotaxis protein
MDGCQFIRALRDRPRHRDTPVVLATSERKTSELLREAGTPPGRSGQETMEPEGPR